MKKSFLCRILCILLTLIMCLGAVACGKTPPPDNEPPTSGEGGGGGETLPPEDPAVPIVGVSPEIYSQFNLAGVDALGREVTGGHNYASTVHVGIWYSLWHGAGADYQQNILDIQDMIDRGETWKFAGDTSTTNHFHYWGEPLYGYYRSEDKWVIMRHMELLTQAGITFLCIDSTNPVIYTAATRALLDTLLELYNAGYQYVIPKVCFYTNTNSANQIRDIKQNFYMYDNQKYNNLWYRPNGKPLIIGTTTNNVGSDVHYGHITKALYDASNESYFEIKESQWPNYPQEDPNGIPWMHWTKIKGTNKPSQTGYIAVPVAQHSQTGSCNVSDQTAEASRGFNNNTQQKGDVASGTSFQTMWDIAHSYKSTLKGVLVTGWNEWIAQKQPGGFFVDVYNNEYSRDAEMMLDGSNGDSKGYADNFYMQLVQNVRKIKLALHSGGNVTALPTKTIDVANTNYPVAWAGVSAVYRDFNGDTLIRDCQNAANGAGASRYTDTTGRNDINTIKVANDNEYLYMYVDCVSNITPYQAGDTGWMNVLIGTEYGQNTFGGYSYMINRAPTQGTTVTTIHQYNGGTWTQVGTAEYHLNGKVITFKIPLSAIGGSASIRFKVSDNVQNDIRFTNNPIMNYYITGDSAPLGRLGYTYNF